MGLCGNVCSVAAIVCVGDVMDVVFSVCVLCASCGSSQCCMRDHTEEAHPRAGLITAL